MRGITSPRVLVILIVVLFIITQLTRFENTLTVTYTGQKIVGDMGVAQIDFPYQNETFNTVAARFQKSSINENGLKSISIVNQDNLEIFSHNSPVIYIFGKDIFGSLYKGTYNKFKRTSGDWSIDTFVSGPVMVYNETLPENFSIHTKFVGRGYKALKLLGTKNVTFEIYDGLMGNKFCMSRGSNEYTICICPGSNCTSVSTGKIEPIYSNVVRISNMAAEVLFVALCILLIVRVSSNRKGVRK